MATNSIIRFVSVFYTPRNLKTTISSTGVLLPLSCLRVLIKHFLLQLTYVV